MTLIDDYFQPPSNSCSSMKSDSFFEQVYQLIATIPIGKVATYGQIAALLGHPRAARMVGWALHQLPAHRDLPWHRVINRNGCVSYDVENSSPPLQMLLLKAEGVEFDINYRVDLKKYQYTFKA
jgi:methylated-DNA-protein-cysteine methyltransferase-like protein